MLGKANDVALAQHDEAVKIAGQMLKANLIKIDDLPAKVAELSKASAEILEDYKKMIRQASHESKKGLQKEAEAGKVETAFVQQSSGTNDDPKSELKSGIQSLFTLDNRNKDFEKYSDERGNHNLWR